VAGPGTLRRIAVITTEIGVRSEVWMLRQFAAFTRVEPVLFGWTEAAASVPLPPGLEVRRFGLGDTRQPDLPARIQRRLGLAGGYLPDAATRRHIRETLAAANVDAVLCHFAWNAIPIAAALEGKLPIIAQVHGRDVSTMLANPSYRRALATILPGLDYVAAVGRFQLDRLAPLGLPAGHGVIPCGAPTAQFGSSPLPERGADAPIRFVTVGRVSAEKGVEQTLAAFEAVHAAHPASELIFVGEGPAEADLDRAITASPATAAISRTGYLPPPELARLLSTCHVLVQHSREVGGWIEGFGVMLTEGGAAGLALVASDFGGIPDQVQDGVNGLLFPPNDIDAQAAAMLRLAHDEPLRRSLGESARRIAHGFDSRRMAAQIEDRILEAIAAHAPR
jgi:glycosyltransferase involved in cell wall biosynthesis